MNESATYEILYNPHAGSGRGLEQTKAMLPLLGGATYTLHDVTAIGDYAAFFAAMPADARVLLTGGDGTLNHFINNTADIEIGHSVWYYPTGSGNDFWTDLGSDKAAGPVCIDQYLEDLPTVTVNGRDHRFLNGIGYGIDGYCCLVGDAQREKTDKPVNYTAIAIKGLLFHYHPTNAVITVDGVRHEYKKVWLAPTMNGRYYGGGMIPTPDQKRLGPGRELSVMVYYGSGKIKSLAVFPSIFKGEHVRHTEMVEVLTGRDITVEFDRPTPLQIDGETIPDVTSYRAVSHAAVPAGV